MNKNEISSWLTIRIADIIGCSPCAVDSTKRFDRLGLDSMAIIGLAAEIEQKTGITLSSDTLTEYRTIDDISSFLLKVSKND